MKYNKFKMKVQLRSKVKRKNRRISFKIIRGRTITE